MQSKKVDLNIQLISEYFFIYNFHNKFCASSVHSVPSIDQLSIALSSGDSKKNAALQSDSATQLKVSLAFSTLLESIPVAAISNEMSADRSDRPTDPKINIILQYITENHSSIYALLPLIFSKVSLKSMMAAAKLNGDRVIFTCPLLAFPEVNELENLYDLALKDLNFIISLNFDRSISKDEILNLWV